MTYSAGDIFPNLTLRTIKDRDITLPTTDSAFIHLQFRRFAGCPICSLHLREFTKRDSDLKSSGIQEVVVFHSSKEAMLPYLGALPFDAVADPKKLLYQQFGVESSPKAKLHPKAWLAVLLGMFVTKPTTKSEGGTSGLPADFLVCPDGKIKAVKYGAHAADQWSVAELLELVKG